MDSYLLAAVFGFAGTVVGAGGTMLSTIVQSRVQSRRESGTVNTADASTLFQTMHALISTLVGTTTALAGRLDEMGVKFGQLADRIDRMVQQQEELIALQHEQLKSLHAIESSTATTAGAGFVAEPAEPQRRAARQRTGT
jgi:hypothetical protein